MTLPRRSLLLSLTAAATLAAAGCAAEPRVMRAYDGRLVEGRYVPPEAYAAFLRGALAEEAGDLPGALRAYTEALEDDDHEAALWVALGEARCKLDPKDEGAERAFSRALSLDPASASARAGQGRCALARGKTEEAAVFARKAAQLDPRNVGLEALAVRAEAMRADPASRDRAIALTVAHGQYAAAWDALVTWGNARRDAELVTRGLEGLVHAAPARTPEVERGALALLAGGQPALARRLAAAVADAPRALGVIGPREATVARLAVDEALARDDKRTALARATRGHVPLAEVAARALLLDQRAIAASVATALAEADPGASGAAMVKEALASGGAGAPALAVRPGGAAKPRPPATTLTVTDQPPELCALLFADRLATAAGNEAARAWLAKITRIAMPPHDPLAGPLAVDLAARGIVPMADIPEGLRESVQHARASE